MPASLQRRAERVALLSVFSNTTLTVLKFLVGLVTGSVSILSEALHSSMDLVASVIAFLAVRVSRKPADRDHPWGHGKAENLSGLAEGLLIFGAAALIVSEALKKLWTPHEVSEPLWGLGIMALSAAVNSLVSFLLYRTAQKTGSLALEADALHLKTDVYTSAGVALGLGLVWATGWSVLDPLAALAVAVLIVKEAWNLVRRSFPPLMDGALTGAEGADLEALLDPFLGPEVAYHDLKARRSGHQVFVEFHLTVPGATTLAEAHGLADRIEAALAQKDVVATIHMEPSEAGDGRRGPEV